MVAALPQPITIPFGTAGKTNELVRIDLTDCYFEISLGNMCIDFDRGASAGMAIIHHRAVIGIVGNNPAAPGNIGEYSRSCVWESSGGCRPPPMRILTLAGANSGMWSNSQSRAESAEALYRQRPGFIGYRNGNTRCLRCSIEARRVPPWPGLPVHRPAPAESRRPAQYDLAPELPLQLSRVCEPRWSPFRTLNPESSHHLWSYYLVKQTTGQLNRYL